MKAIALVLCLFVACSSEPPRANLAMDFVHSVAPAVECEPYYTHEGEQRLHSARCKLPLGNGKHYIAYCSISLTQAPNCTDPPKLPPAEGK